MMTRKNGERPEGLAADIRRQMSAEATKRFLRNLPAFRADNDIPEHFRELLNRLDSIENMVASDRSR
ncbi:hypothetical protein [Mesorhizobium shangrilense]|uniref:Anti-sigma factor NepR domain-containing protein n=1 Tax=Mesorhizobium shangrilense TaxID=460060 RepID=A0ABV2DJM8_9HYPH